MRIFKALFCLAIVLWAVWSVPRLHPVAADAPTGRTFIYVNNNDFENSVSGFSVTSNGQLQPLPGSPYSTGGLGSKVSAIGGLTVCKKARLLFATNNNDNTLTDFRINNDGSLSRLGVPIFTGGRFAAGVACNKQGTKVFVANIDADNIAAFNIDSNGIISPTSDSPFPAGNGPIDLAINKAGTILFASHEFSHSIGVYQIDSSGGLRLINDVTTLGLTNHGLTLNLNTSRLYVAELGNRSISGFRVDLNNGNLALLPNTPYFTDGEQPIAVTTTPNGQFVYATNTNTSTISIFASQPDGSLIAIPNSPFNTDGLGPAGMVVNKRGTLLFIANGGFAGSKDVSVYHIAANGTLTSVPGSPFTTGSIGIPSAIGILETK